MEQHSPIGKSINLNINCSKVGLKQLKCILLSNAVYALYFYMIFLLSNSVLHSLEIRRGQEVIFHLIFLMEGAFSLLPDELI